MQIKTYIILLLLPIYLSLVAQETENPQSFKTKNIEVPFNESREVKSIYQNEKLYILASKFWNRTSETPKVPTVYIYNNDGILELTKPILTEQYDALDIYRNNNHFYVCGRYITSDSLTSNSYPNIYKYSGGFFAELSDNLDLIRILHIPGTIFWKVNLSNNSLYLLGELVQKKAEFQEYKIKSYLDLSIERENPYTGENEKIDINSHDVVLLKLDSTFKINKLNHYAIDGYFQNGASLIINNNGFVTFSVNTSFPLEEGRNDGNLFLIDNNFKMLWHKQFTNLDNCDFHTMPLIFNNKNEVLAYVKTSNTIESKNSSKLPNYKRTLKLKSKKEKKQESENLILYDRKGKIMSIAKSCCFWRPTINPEISNYFTYNNKGETYEYFALGHNENEAYIQYIHFNINGDMNKLSLPDKFPPFLIRDYNWKIITLEK